MAEMTAAEAVGVLGGSEKQPKSEQELITSIIAGMTRGEKCFVLLWDSERVQLAALIEQQAQEIKRLQTREHRMIEYMRDVKNFAVTINEVANNAIEEAEVQDG